MTVRTEHEKTVGEYYATYPEELRLAQGTSRLEFERTKDILTRVLPPAPARVIDVGGAAGAYSAWLAGRGYEVHLVDLSPRLVEEARRRHGSAPVRIESFTVGDARALPQEDGFADAVLVMGPLYHLTQRGDRVRALVEAVRVTRPGGVVAGAAISRYASTLDGLARRLTLDPRFVAIRDRDLRDGQHRNETERIDYFTTAYFHRPDDLHYELAEADLRDVRVFGVEGPGWILQDFEERWGNDALRADLLHVARVLEEEPSIVGASAHLLGVGRKM
ncbi:MAG TPA: class I SAM-dependent methyltransferase [Candidatus Eisenbacteria bacterium]|nr:class I SAM-dependent methyltransferase [Candidatus Eisenbacteria bacterium]